MAYDAAQHSIVLFGGLPLPSRMTNDTWVWNGRAWSQLHPASSPPALQGSMVYDAASQQVILLLSQVQSGGIVANEQWAWDGTTWHQLHPSTLPEVIGASMVYDAARQQIVLFGGGVPNGHLVTYMNATWTWDGATWQQRQPAMAPQPRAGAAMAYDSARQQVVLYGGTGPTGAFTDTWVWDGTTWQQQHPALMPPARQQTQMVYDDATRQTTLFSGISATNQEPLSDTWTWNGATWTQLADQGAPEALYESAAYDSDQQAIVVYAAPGAGKTAPSASQTWLWNGSAWTLWG